MATTESAATKTGLNLSIDRMTEHDLVEVCQIEDLSGLSAWGWDAYHHELQSRGDSIMLVAKIDSTLHEFELAGFIVARTIADELHVNNVAVRHEFRGRGIGSVLLQTSLDEGRKRKARIAQLEVRAGNEAAQQLYRRCGFEGVGRAASHYPAAGEGGLFMSVLLASYAHGSSD